MTNKNQPITKLILASTLAFTSGGITFATTGTSAYAEQGTTQSTTETQTQTQINFEEQSTKFLKAAMEGDWKTAHALLSKNLQPLLPEEQLTLLWGAYSSPYGAIKEQALKEVKNDGVHTKVIFTITAENATYELNLKLDNTGSIDDFYFAPSYPPNLFLNPEYNNPDNYTEKQVVIGEGAFALPGILTVPKGEGPFPVVVLVHGSGPNDMDATAYTVKPFRDIAVGLANEGIAVLRYDKRTNAHLIKSAVTPKLTIQEETVMDANLAVEKLKSMPEINSENIFVLGHSQGAFALPLILDNDKNGDIKGGIWVSGLAGTFPDFLLRQYEERVERAENMKLPAEQIEAIKKELAAFQQQYDIITNPDLTLENLPAELAQLYWFIDIRDYNPIDLAKEQDVPLLLLHGAKDLQVSPSHLETWKQALQGRDNVQSKLYSDMFHFLVNYEGEPDGFSEYSTKGNVPQEFLTDISQWVKTGKIATDLKEFKDYKDNEYWSEAFSWAVNEGIIQGYENEKLLKPHNAISEAEFLKVLLRYTIGSELTEDSTENVYKLAKEAGLPVTENASAALNRGNAAIFLAKAFTNGDMSTEEAVNWLYEQNIATGNIGPDGQTPKTYESYKPEQSLSRAQLVTMLYRLNQSLKL